MIGRCGSWCWSLIGQNKFTLQTSADAGWRQDLQHKCTDTGLQFICSVNGSIMGLSEVCMQVCLSSWLRSHYFWILRWPCFVIFDTSKIERALAFPSFYIRILGSWPACWPSTEWLFCYAQDATTVRSYNDNRSIPNPLLPAQNQKQNKPKSQNANINIKNGLFETLTLKFADDWSLRRSLTNWQKILYYGRKWKYLHISRNQLLSCDICAWGRRRDIWLD